VRTSFGVVNEAAQATDVNSALARFLASVTEFTNAADTDQSETDSDTNINESVRASDTVSSRYLWEPINDDQVPNWKPINTVN
jgi:hypothetical protein